MLRVYTRKIILCLGIAFFLFLTTRHLARRNLLLLPAVYINDASSQHQVNIRTPAYTPAMLMLDQQQQHGNLSACTWKHGLPILLAYTTNNIIGTPAAGEKSPYRVLPFIIRGDDKSLPKLTLCTHATADQIYNIVEIVRRWEGPVSLAVFAPGRDAELAIHLLERVCRCEPQLYKV